MKTKINKPAIIQIVIHSVITTLLDTSSGKTDVPVKIGKYDLVSPIIKKQGSIENFKIGVYESEGKKYFGKTWVGARKNLSYYTLLNEYRVCRLLSKKLRKLNSRLRIPCPMYIKEKENTLSVIFEYVDAVDISDRSVENQMRIYEEILGDLRTVSQSLSESEKQVFTKRGIVFYLLSLPFLFFLSLKSNPTLIRHTIKAMYKTLSSLTHDDQLIITHRDLHPQNVKMKAKHIYLLDCEDMTLTLQGFDLADISIWFQNQSKSRTISVNLDHPSIKFFENYISIHRSSNKYHDDRYKNYLRR